jgi:hypothetical protein
MTHPEALLSGPSAALTVIERPAVAGAVPQRRDLTQAQLEWLAERHPGIFRNRVERVEGRK